MLHYGIFKKINFENSKIECPLGHGSQKTKDVCTIIMNKLLIFECVFWSCLRE